jgi:acetyltransferase-like isoleucine patch superfamily enzyme
VNLPRLFLYKWRNYWLKRRSPKMINGFTNSNGEPILGTSVSNSTFIDNPHKLILGTKVYIGHHNFIEASHEITIEEGCQITNFVTITTHSSHNSIRLYGKQYGGSDMVGYKTGSVRIGKYSFIGPHTTIAPNTSIGKGSIVSAYSYVQGVFPDFAIISGNPAIVIGDTRDRDQKYFIDHPELKQYYDEWAN